MPQQNKEAGPQAAHPSPRYAHTIDVRTRQVHTPYKCVQSAEHPGKSSPPTLDLQNNNNHNSTRNQKLQLYNTNQLYKNKIYTYF